MNPHKFLAQEMRSFNAGYEYIHNGEARISTAFDIAEKSEIKLKIPRAVGTTNIYLELFAEDCYTKICEVEGVWDGLCYGFDEYIFDIPIEKLGCGLYFLLPRLVLLTQTLYGHKNGSVVSFNCDGNRYNMLQLSVCNFEYAEPDKIKGGVIYHVFVDRFCRGGSYEVPDGARIVPGKWRSIPEYPEYPGAPLYNNTFYGGTLWGVIEKLDYIKSLGVSALYLSPIFRAYSNHKYDTADYLKIDPIFGGEEAFLALIKACKERNIQIILDGVFNHTGSDSIYFNRYGRYEGLGAFQSKKSEYYDWYSFDEYPRKYSCWWGIDTLPRINPDNPKCGDYFVGEDGVIDKYSKMGVYGFRLDVADELSDDFISKIKARLSKNNKDNILYGEVWEDASNKCSYGARRKYYLGNELDGVMNYPVRTGIIDFLLNRGSGSLFYALTEVTANAPRQVINNQMNLLGTHDTERIITMLGNVNVDGKSNSELAKFRMDTKTKNAAVDKLICAYTILATIPGIPTIFYGDEAGLEGYRDPFNRMPFPWGNENKRLLEHYRKIGAIRKDNPVYKDGDFKLCYLDNECLVFTRNDDQYSFVTIVNNSNKLKEICFDDESIELLSGERDNTFSLIPFSSSIFKVSKNSTVEIG